MKRKLDAPSNIKARKKKKDGKPKIMTAEEREKWKTSLYRAPTSEELSELQENENLFKNNLFRMQIQYLLEEVCLEEKKTKKINGVLHSLNNFLKSLPSQKKEHDVSGDCLPKDITLPLPDVIPRKRIKGKFQFFPPEEVKIVGSYLLKTITKPSQCVDVAVEMPKASLQARDYLNYRYHYKRAIYLTWLASALKNWDHCENVYFTCDYDVYKPVILIKLKGKVGNRFSIKIHIMIPDGIFKLNRFSPLKNNVRANWYENLEAEATQELDFPTSQYNSSMLKDMLYEIHLHALYNALQECPGIREAICLFKVWLKQRSFKGTCSFDGFIGSMLMVYLLSSRKISAHMSSYQIFRLVLHSLALSDWSITGISLCEQNEIKLGDFHSVYDVVFVDTSGYLNLCSNVNKITYEMVRHQAKLSLDILDNSSVDGFEALFIKCHHFLQAMDYSFRLYNLDDFKEKVSQLDTYKSSIIDSGGDWTLLVPKLLPPILKKGLDTRHQRLILKPYKIKQWSVTLKPPAFAEQSFWFGLQLNTEFSDNILIMGPPADQPEANDFRSFWGEKSELRRFQDGSINEAVLWPCDNTTQKKLIWKRIIQHLLNIHCNIPPSSICYHGDEFNTILQQKFIVDNNSGKHKSKFVPGCGEEESLHLIKSFDELCRQIRSLGDLPLNINSIHGIDAAFRLTQVETTHQCKTKTCSSEKTFLVPKPRNKCPNWCPVYHACIQFETSGKWPDDIEAIQHIKAAFHIKIADSIKTQLHIPAIATPTFLDILQNGYVFRLSVVHYREMILCKQSEATSLLKKEHELAGKELDILIVKKPIHSTLIHSLNSQHHAYALTTRLAKRWTASQMLTDYVCDEALELIIAHLFLSPAPMDVPSSHMSGFLRFLNFLSKFDWQNEALIVNLNKEISGEEKERIQETFSSNRSQLPPMFIATSYDREVSVWTKINPTQQILRRISLLADAALLLAENDVDLLSVDIAKRLFRPSLCDYHLVITLNKDYVPQHHLAIDAASLLPKPAALTNTLNNSCLPVVNFDPPSLFLKGLREAFSDVALFFYDKYGGLNIGVVWKNLNSTPQPFKILDAQYKTIAKKQKACKKDVMSSTISVLPNIPAIISDFYVIGKGLVSNVRENKQMDGNVT